jgi:putative hydrolase of the HAD superfamily
MDGLKNIIFDLGGVIYDLNHGLSHKAFQSLGMPGIDKLFSHSGQSEIFDHLEMGIISPEEFRESIRQLGGKNLKDEEIDNAFNALLTGFNHPEYFDFLKKLKGEYRTFLLSNNNAIHYDFLMKELEGMGLEPSLSPYFEKDYYSHLMGMRKPHPEIFEEVLEEEGLIPEETLFIDDTLVHIITAKGLGLQTYHKRQEENLMDILHKVLIKKS